MWKEELVKILFSNDTSKINAKKAINLKYEYTPSSLYRYRPFNERSLELLETDKIWLSIPTSFNDPFDCALKLAVNDLPNEYIKKVLLEPNLNHLKQKFKFTDKELRKSQRKKDVVHELVKIYLKKKEPHLTLIERNKKIEEMENNIKNSYLELDHEKNIHVACFSETKKSILMWAHYANNHKGFCVEYDFKELGLNNHYTRFIFPVFYKKAIFDMKDYIPDPNKKFDNVLTSYMDQIKAEDILDGITNPEVNINVNNMALFYNALIKYKDWAYEKEWRYVFPYKNNANKSLYLYAPKPKAIYLGAKITNESRETLVKIAKERKIKIYQMEIKTSEFALESNIV